MPRTKSKTNGKSTDTVVQPASPFQAAARGKKGLMAAGLSNMREGLRLTDTAARFANPFVAAGFCARLARQPFTSKELEQLEAEGRALFLALGVDAEGAADHGAGQEVLVSLPVARLDQVDRFHVWGLKRSRLSHREGYLELRGRCDLEAATRLVEELGGTIVQVTRPAAPGPADADESDQASAPELASMAPASPSGPSGESAEQTDPARLVVAASETDVADADASHADVARADAPSADAQDPAAAASGHVDHLQAPQPEEKSRTARVAADNASSASPQAAAINKLIDDNARLEDVPPFLQKAWQHERLRRGLEAVTAHPPNIPALRQIKPPGGVPPRR